MDCEKLKKEIIELKEEIHKLKHDDLTGFGNRYKLKDFLNYISSENSDYVVCLVDLNNLHKINRKYGWEKGNEYILEFSEYLKKELKYIKSEIFRIGGDEFLIFSKKPFSIKEKYGNYVYEIYNPLKMDFRKIFNKLDKKIIQSKAENERKSIND